VVAARPESRRAPPPHEASGEQIGGAQFAVTHPFAHVKNVTPSNAASPGNAGRQPRRVIPRCGRETDRVGAHAAWPQLGCLPDTLTAQLACLILAEPMFRSLLISLLVEFIGHVAIVADTAASHGS
jgi:hypothetical protein